MSVTVGIGGLLLCAGSAAGDVVYEQDFENWNNSDGLWSKNTQASLGGAYTNVLGRFGNEAVSLVVQAPVGQGGSEPGGGMPFNITLDTFFADQQPEPVNDSSGGGGHGGPIGDTNFDYPQLNLGGTVFDGTNPGQSLFGAGTYALHFDLMVFDSWDGDYAPHGPDSFSVAVNGQTLFDEFFFSSAYGSGFNFREPDETPELNAYDSLWVDSIYRDVTVLIELTEASEYFDVLFRGDTSQDIDDESWGLDNVRIERLVDGLGLSAPEVPAPSALMVFTGGLGLFGRRKRS